MANLFLILLFLWAMVALMCIAQFITWVFMPWKAENDPEYNPNVWTWRRK
jgi:hypothetical protein